MNKTKYMQTDSRWGGLGYPRKPHYIRNCGCGEVAICNIIIEMEAYKGYTPATIQPYCKQYADPNGNGTYWSGIPAMMKHYGMTEVKEHATMDKLWKELAKGGRIAIYLMGSRKGGSKGVHWTSSGHFVMSSGYKYEDGKHWVYVKDSYSNSSLRNKWISYEGNMRNDVVKVWSGKLNGKPTPTPTPVPEGKLAVDGIGGTATVKRMQEFFGTTVDGIISGQNKKQSVYYPALDAVQFGRGGSACVKAMQKWLGVSQDGIIGRGTTCAWQKRLRDEGYLAKNETIDGYFGVKSMKAWQKYLNDHDKATMPTTPAPTPAPTPTPKPVQSATPQSKICAAAKKISDDVKYKYIPYAKAYAKKCGFCKPIKGKGSGGNCIVFAFHCWHVVNGCKCSFQTMTNQLYEKLLKVSSSEALKIVQGRTGLKDIKVLVDKGGIPISKLKPGDIIAYFNGNKYIHTALYVGDGKIADCTSGRKDAVKYGVTSYSKWKIKIAIRYTGK